MRIQQIIANPIQPILKQAGFRKKGHLWNRYRERFVDVLDIQRAKVDVPGSEEFTINLGIFVPEFYEVVWGEKIKGFAKEVDCAFRLRIGPLLQECAAREALDIWWNLESQKDVESAGEEISCALRDKVLPFFESFRSIQDIHDYIENVEPGKHNDLLAQIYLALAKIAIGDADACDKILMSIIQGPSKGWADRASLIRINL